ncbi:MAG: LTA synthase family protein [Verrucomicrobia bacterium]|nr:LTA synthase family protein [Verrucomicrobiota bacterium]
MPAHSHPAARRFAASRLVRWVLALALLFLAVMTLLRLATYLCFNYEGVGAAGAWPAFVLGLRFDVRVVASALLALLVLGSLRPLDPFGGRAARRLWLGLLALCSGVLVLLYATDFLHFRYLNQRLSATVLGFLGDARISAGMVWQSYPVLRILAAMAVGIGGLVAACHWLHRRVAATEPAASRKVRAAWFAAAVVACVLGIWGRVAQFPLRWSDAFNLRSDALAHLALNPFQSFASSFGFEGAPYDLARVREAYPRMSAYLGVTAPDPARLDLVREVPAARPRPPGPPGGPPNVVLVICESFSGYKSSMWGNPLDPTPFFAALCREGVFFDNCFTPHVGTARGVWATLTGLPDTEPRETASRNPALVDQHSIVNDFTAHEKLYFLGGSSSWANIRGLLTNNLRGLRLYEEGSFTSPQIDVWGISDKNLFLEANEILRRETRPFFAVIQTADNHRPYTIPKEDLVEFRKVSLPAEQLRRGGFESNEELNAFRYTDFTFRKFMEAARQAPYFERTIFVFIGDHGIGGDAGTMFPPAWTRQNLTCYHVPLLFYAPGWLAPRRIGAVASQIDLLPTLAGIVGLPYRNSGLGRDLLRQQALDGGRSNAAFIIDHNTKSVGVVHGSYFLNHRREGGREELVWSDFTAPPPSGAPPAADEHRALALGFFETARYLLRHNAKPRGTSPREPTD